MNLASDAPAPSIPFLTLGNFVRASGLCGIAFEVILKEVGWQAPGPAPEMPLIPVRDLEQLMRLCTAEAQGVRGGRHFPFAFGESFGFEGLHDIETFLATSTTPRQAMPALDWMHLFVHPLLKTRLDEGPERSRMVLMEGADPREDTVRYLAEATFASMLKFGHVMFGGPPPLIELHFAHKAPAYAHLYEPLFQVPVKFGQPETASVFPTAMLDMPLRGAFQSLNQQAARRVEQRLAQFPRQGGLLAELEQAFEECPALLGLKLDAMSERLCMSRRTLQRRLLQEGHSYSAVQAAVRQRLARQWLREGKRSIEEISAGLGFADRRGFTQAFTRWCGQSPSEFRRSAGWS